MTGLAPGIYSVPPGLPFLDSVAKALLGCPTTDDGANVTTSHLSRATILLPTMRACRAIQDAFLRAGASKALLLPRIAAISDADEDAGLITSLATRSTGAELDWILPPSVSELERRLALTQLVLRWSRAVAGTSLTDGGAHAAPAAGSPAQACRLAAELGSFMDLIETEGVSISRLSGLVPEMFSGHWQQTLEFLKIVTEAWPAHLGEQNLMSAADRRNRLLGAEAERLCNQAAALADQGGAVEATIIAGVTGSIPATAKLIKAVLSHPAGTIILPGLDRVLDEQSWSEIRTNHPEHPQYGLCKLLHDLEIVRQDVSVLPGGVPPEQAADRQRIISEALRPATTTHHWHEFIAAKPDKDYTQALSPITYLKAATSREEGKLIALILRGAVEQPGKTAALVTPDRNLARRVAAELNRWGIVIDDSAGRPLAKTVPGTFFDLIIEAVAKRFSPPALMALLKHPLTRLGMPAGEVRGAARQLELEVFRRTYLGQGLDGIQKAIKHHTRRAGAGTPAEMSTTAKARWAVIADLVERLETAFSPLSEGDYVGKPARLVDHVRRHVLVAEELARPDPGNELQLWSGEAGEVAARFVGEMISNSTAGPELRAGDYPEFFRALMGDQVVRPRSNLHPRLFIWGPIEARLQQTDIMILGGLNERTWPEVAEPDPWLNRPMRRELGLPAPEQRIGMAAHDFAQLVEAPVVYLTRAQKTDGVPTVPSRWILRLEALLGGMELHDVLNSAPETPWLEWVRVDDNPPAVPSARQPAPVPAVAARPRKLSVTKIETWIANPYAIYAQYVLGLRPLDPLTTAVDASLRGKIIHDAMHRLAVRQSDNTADDIARELTEIATQIMRGYAAQPRVMAFWLPRFERFAAWFGNTEVARRSGVVLSSSEIEGSRWFDGPGGRFELTARADRIDVQEDGGVAIYDYKSGHVPRAKRVTDGLAPQLPLEAAIALSGGFAGIETDHVSGLSYISAKGGVPPGEQTDVPGDAKTLAEVTVLRLTELIAEFDILSTPYQARRRDAFEGLYRFDDYAHLARVQEWLSGGADG